MSDAHITVYGNVASDVHTVPMRNGEEIASFRLASQRRYHNRRTGQWVDDEPSFFRVVCWRSALATNVVKSVKKGEAVVVNGRVKLKDWTDDHGKQRTDAEIDAWSVGYDLARGTAEFTRSRRAVITTDDGDPLDAVRSEQRARESDEVIADPQTGEVFSVSQLQRERTTTSNGTGASVGTGTGEGEPSGPTAPDDAGSGTEESAESAGAGLVA